MELVEGLAALEQGCGEPFFAFPNGSASSAVERAALRGWGLGRSRGVPLLTGADTSFRAFDAAVPGRIARPERRKRPRGRVRDRLPPADARFWDGWLAAGRKTTSPEAARAPRRSAASPGSARGFSKEAVGIERRQARRARKRRASSNMLALLKRTQVSVPGGRRAARESRSRSV